MGAVPLLVTRIVKLVAEPALALVDRTWSGVETSTVKLPVISICRSASTVLPPPVAVTVRG